MMWPFSRKPKPAEVRQPRYTDAHQAAQARKVKQLLELGNTDEAMKRAEYFRGLDIKVETIKDCDRILEGLRIE